MGAVNGLQLLLHDDKNGLKGVLLLIHFKGGSRWTVDDLACVSGVLRVLIFPEQNRIEPIFDFNNIVY